MSNYTGGCLCGAIRYEIEGEPVRVGICHCDDCRKTGGASFTTNAFFSTENIKVVQGTPKSHDHQTDAGFTLTKEFCGDCGTPLFRSSNRGTGVKSVHIGTFDDVKDLRPSTEVYVKRALPFVHLMDETEHYEERIPQ